jgi:DNA-binding response OmpR family regulator/nitrogen-specific signal transduction histidine kinase
MNQSTPKPVILNVDDDDASRYAITRELLRSGYDVIEAATGEETLRLIHEKRVELILLDVRLPDTNGFEVCRQIREDPETAGLPILLLSASYLDSHSKVMGLDGGADAYLTEPADPQVLLATIRALLRLKRAELAVRDRVLQWRTTFNAIQDGVALLNWDGAVTQANSAFESIAEPIGQQISAGFDRLLSTAKRQTIEQSLGSKILTITLDPVSGEAGGISGAVCIVADVTEKKRFEQQLQHTQKLESIGVLAGGIAHDFNNLLTGILGNAGLLLSDLRPGSPERELALQIFEASESAASLTRQILAYSGKGRFVMEPVDLSAVASDSRNLVRRFIPKGVELIYELAKDLPLIEADPAQMQQVAMNLIINAAESFGEDGKGEVRIKTESRMLERSFFQSADPGLEPGPFALLAVSDSGCGMDEATQQRIFEPFFTTKFTGRGLGLSAVHGILRGHRGLLRLRSRPSAGTTIELYFPAALAAASPSLKAAEVSYPKKSETILVIDDETAVQQFAKNALERQGYNVVTADDGQAGVKLFADMHGKIALVLLDFTMPVMSGEETLAHLRRIDPSVPIVLSSGFGHDTALQRFEGKGLDGFIGKPYTLPKLTEVVASALKSERSEQ